MIWKAFLNNACGFLFAALAFLIVLCFTNHGGIGISPDSIAYVSVARNVVNGQGLIGYDKEPFVLFPIFYPALLSIFMLFSGKDIMAFAPVFNGLLFALLCFYSVKILKVNNFLKWTTLLAIVFSIALIEVYTMLWSETIFILLTILFIITLNKYQITNQVKYLILSALIVSIACITRYAAITVFASGLLLLFINREKFFKNRIKDCLVFGIIGVSCLLFNLIRNYISTDILTGKRQPSITSLFKNIQLFGNVFGAWFCPFKINDTISLCIGFVILIGFSVLFLYLIYKNTQNGYLYTTCGFFIVYAWFMIISATISRYEPINSRLLSPIFIPFLIVIVSLIEKVAIRYSYKIFITSGVFVMLVFTFVQLKANIINFNEANESGIGGYTEDMWRESQTLNFLKIKKQFFKQRDITVYSNANQAVYFYTNKSADELPERKYADDVKEFYEDEQFYLVWFNFEDNTDLLNLNDVNNKYSMQVLKRFDDGAIYLCKVKH